MFTARDVLLEQHAHATGTVDPTIEQPIRPEHLREANRRLRQSERHQAQALPAQRYRAPPFV